MATYTVRHEGQDHGPYTLEALKTYIAAGSIRPTDLWRCAPDEPWQPISALHLTPTPTTPVQPARPAPTKQTGNPLLALGTILVIALVIIGACTSKSTPEPATPSDPEQQAQIAKHGEMDAYLAEVLVKRHLKNSAKDPESVKIYGMTELYYTPKGWAIGADWGARNSFGGMVRSSTIFTLSKKQVIDATSIEGK